MLRIRVSGSQVVISGVKIAALFCGYRLVVKIIVPVRPAWLGPGTNLLVLCLLVLCTGLAADY
jgi:hypothetical protein